MNYYRSTAPNAWGTSNYRFAHPPEPHFRPQPTWGGLDYYQAHALNPDPSLYRRIREGQYDAEGVGLHEARHWHRLAYGGFGDVRALHPRELGHAAAYEAYRIWIHNPYMSDQRSDFGERREAFLALAVAEVSHIFPSGQVHHERRKFREACETAAASASTIFHTLDDDGYSNGSHTSPSHSSFRRSGSNSSDDYADDLYALDERHMPRGSHRHRRRSSSVSFNSRPTMIPQNVSPYQHSSSMPMQIPGAQPNYGYPGGSPYQPGGSPYSNPSPYVAPSSYPQQYGGVQGVPVLGSNYDPNQALLYQNPGSYPQQTYIQAQPGMSQSVPMQPGSTIVIQQPSQSSRHSKRHHKHRSSSRDSRRRHRSYSEVYPVYT
ncbi:hypothetical protein BJ322DRAFT_1034470 [Thelephora terrestris]|uniref:Uncharacterized protein n=1 Tax=Thelephora terrestris TaxID=56493 RepID=A0A9P6LE67_9AGAM|nr:hypothetical protein BJ322DRAFT_1034470 [Thelephora terrestris]